MCLNYSEKRTNEVRKLLEKSLPKPAIFYKMYYTIMDKYCDYSSKWENQFGPGFALRNLYFAKRKSIRKPGYVVSNRRKRELSQKETGFCGRVYKGIHVFETEEEATNYRDILRETASVVPVICSLKDFVAAGTFDGSRNNSVFMKIRISAETWKKLQKENE